MNKTSHKDMLNQKPNLSFRSTGRNFLRNKLAAVSIVTGLAISNFMIPHSVIANDALAAKDLIISSKSSISPVGEKMDHVSVNKIARQGFIALSEKNYNDAVRALEIAAEHGHNAARWKLAHLYRAGLGVEKNDYKAFQLFLDIATQYKKFGFERVNKRQVSDAFKSLASYLKQGIPDSPVKINMHEANRLFHASAYFGNAEAQFQLGEYYTTHPQEHPNFVQAARWLVKANRKGHIKASALLGQLMFQGQGVELSPEFGLAMATNAMMKAKIEDRPWVEGVYARLYEAADEHQRTIATAILEQDLLKKRKIILRRSSKTQTADNAEGRRSSARIELRLGLKKTERQNKPDINELIFNRVLKK